MATHEERLYASGLEGTIHELVHGERTYTNAIRLPGSFAQTYAKTLVEEGYHVLGFVSPNGKVVPPSYHGDPERIEPETLSSAYFVADRRVNPASCFWLMSTVFGPIMAESAPLRAPISRIEAVSGLEPATMDFMFTMFKAVRTFDPHK